MNKKAANFGIVLLVIGLIIIATAAVFYFSEEKKTTEVPSQPKKLSIEELKLCNNVDENFACNENVDGAFKIGSRFYIYFLVENLEAKKIGDNHKIGFIETRDLLDIDGNIIPEEKGVKVLDVVSNVDSDGYYSKYVKNEIISFPSDKEGVYTSIITVEDKFSGKKDTKEIKFKLEK